MGRGVTQNLLVYLRRGPFGGNVLTVWDAEKAEWLTEEYYRSLILMEYAETPSQLNWSERSIGTNCSFRKPAFSDIGNFDTIWDELERSFSETKTLKSCNVPTLQAIWFTTARRHLCIIMCLHPG